MKESALNRSVCMNTGPHQQRMWEEKWLHTLRHLNSPERELHIFTGESMSIIPYLIIASLTESLPQAHRHKTILWLSCQGRASLGKITCNQNCVKTCWILASFEISHLFQADGWMKQLQSLEQDKFYIQAIIILFLNNVINDLWNIHCGFKIWVISMWMWSSEPLDSYFALITVTSGT